MFSFSPSRTDFAPWVTLSGQRGAEGHAVSVVGIVVVAVAVVVDVAEVVAVVAVGRAEPPISGAA